MPFSRGPAIALLAARVRELDRAARSCAPAARRTAPAAASSLPPKPPPIVWHDHAHGRGRDAEELGDPVAHEERDWVDGGRRSARPRSGRPRPSARCASGAGAGRGTRPRPRRARAANAASTSPRFERRLPGQVAVAAGPAFERTYVSPRDGTQRAPSAHRGLRGRSPAPAASISSTIAASAARAACSAVGGDGGDRLADVAHVARRRTAAGPSTTMPPRCPARRPRSAIARTPGSARPRRCRAA